MDDDDPEPLQFGLVLPWRQWFRARMVEGLEPCRGWCGREGLPPRALRKDGLGFGHILAKSLGGGQAPGNITIVCRPCDVRMGPGDWRGVFVGLTREPVWREFMAHNHEAAQRDPRRQARRNRLPVSTLVGRGQRDRFDAELATLQAQGGCEVRALDEAFAALHRHEHGGVL